MKPRRVAMSVIIWLTLVSFLCVGISAGEGCFGYELIVERLENLENRLVNMLEMHENVSNGKIDEMAKNIAAVNLRISADSVKTQSAIDEKTSIITSKISDQNSRLEKIETLGKAVVKMLEQSNSGIETKNSRLTERLTSLEKTGDAILSRQRSAENIINDLTTGISALGSQSRQILKNHNDLVVTSCDVPTISGIYRLQIPNMNVFCEMVDAGGRWIYIQRRISDDVISFEHNWFTYVSGFGTIGARTSFWLGLEAIHQLTKSANYELLVGIKNEHNEYKEARYSQFKVSGSSDGYRLTVGGYSGTAGDKLSNNAKFSTFDKDNDSSTKNCAKDFNSGWWFTDCRASNLNGPYEKASNGYGIEWGTWADAAKFSKMMIRLK